MTDATELWTEVLANYDPQSLLTLTNIHDPAATVADTTVGQVAAQSVIDLWPAYAQVAYDSTSGLHVEVASKAVIAMLWDRGGTAASIAKQKWDDIFTDGVIAQVKMTSPRAHGGPRSNSGVTQSSELLADGSRGRPWSDLRSLPLGIMPSRRSTDPFD